MGYQKRIIDKILKEKLNVCDAILLTGPRACGKTSSSMQIAKSFIKLDDSEGNFQNMKLALSSPSFVLKGETPRLIDEWQLAPAIFDAVRFEVDKRGEVGQFILTGSNSGQRKNTLHSGIDRIVNITMRTLSLYESNDSTGEVSLFMLFNNQFEMCQSKHSMEDVAFLIVRGGFPRIFRFNTKEQQLTQARNYYSGLINNDLFHQDKKNKNPILIDLILRSISRNIGCRLKLDTILKDITGSGKINISLSTLKRYLKNLEYAYIIDYTYHFTANLRSKTNIRTTPVMSLIDPCIACASLKINEHNIFNDLNTFGFLFEAMVMRDLKVYLSAYDGEVYSYRDSSGLEVDAVVCLNDGRYGLIEIKLGEGYFPEAVKNLNKLENKIVGDFRGKPTFKAIITAKGYAYIREDGIYVIPIGVLRD
ncbi:ATP-binding protein [Ureaplasma canigenitalium]|uniref:ATP-binding protein n=1 Tax=Ureaplasma canigenitalium TaxID=42092 RepID=UPI0004E200AD|nr:DUF4143 domain-containing protein [Ureaplasma canigenitalium]